MIDGRALSHMLPVAGLVMRASHATAAAEFAMPFVAPLSPDAAAIVAAPPPSMEDVTPDAERLTAWITDFLSSSLLH